MLELEHLPVLDEDCKGRIVYVQAMEPELVANLQDKGYRPVDLMSLPRGSHMDEVSYLLAKAQAMEEGTVEGSTESRHRLALLMKAYGLLDPKKEQLNLNISLEGADISTLLDWGGSNHTLRTNTSILDIPTKVDSKLLEGNDGHKHKSRTGVPKRSDQRVRKSANPRGGLNKDDPNIREGER